MLAQRKTLDTQNTYLYWTSWPTARIQSCGSNRSFIDL